MNSKGFTLIELLVVVSIISILSAIAIPQFVQYQRGAKANASARLDIRTAAIAEEAYFSDNNEYTSSIEVLNQERYGFRASPGVTIRADALKNSFTLKAKVQGCDGELIYSQQDGKIIGDICK